MRRLYLNILGGKVILKVLSKFFSVLLILKPNLHFQLYEVYLKHTVEVTFVDAYQEIIEISYDQQNHIITI